VSPDEERTPGGGQTNLAAGSPSVFLGVTRGFVALLDVLGFSNLVSGDAAGTRLQQYVTSLQEALTVPDPGPAVQYVVFSDTIVLTTNDDELTSFQALLLRCSRVLGLMLEREVAVRGAISHGSYVRSAALAGGVFVAGTAIIDAYRFEKNQDWVGIMVAPSALRRVPDLKARCALEGLEASTVEGQREVRRRTFAPFVQPCQTIPFHKSSPLDDNDFEGFAVVPSTGDATPAALRDSLGGTLTALERLKLLAPDPAAQAKYERSRRWLRNIANQWRAIADWNERLHKELERER